MPINTKAQVLIITVFAIILTSVIVFVLLLPILAQLRSWQETSDTYQALANAESGLELELLNQSYATTTFSNKLGNKFNCNMGRNQYYFPGGQHSQSTHGSDRSDNCKLAKGYFNLKMSTSSIGTYQYLRIESEGVSGRFSRTLLLITRL